MIKRLSVGNFKAFRNVELDIAPLTVLTGLNSTGKSTAIQAILLAQLARLHTQTLPLNGPYGLALGEAANILHYEAEEAVVRIRIESLASVDEIAIEIPEFRSLLARFTRSGHDPIDQPGLVTAYLSAERLGPRDLLEMTVQPDRRQSGGSDVGYQGEYVAHALATREREQVPVERRLRVEDAPERASTLASQTEQWLSAIVRPIFVQATWLPETNAATVRFRDPDRQADWLRPANVGFGLSFSLPIVVAGLTTPSGGLLIVENPEAHLHPAGQSMMGRFLVSLARSGVQVIAETHSDHVLNGMRLALSDRQRPDPNEFICHFFDSSKIHRIAVDAHGGLSSWPSGFFDQAENDLAALSRITWD